MTAEMSFSAAAYSRRVLDAVARLRLPRRAFDAPASKGKKISLTARTERRQKQNLRTVLNPCLNTRWHAKNVSNGRVECFSGSESSRRRAIRKPRSSSTARHVRRLLGWRSSTAVEEAVSVTSTPRTD